MDKITDFENEVFAKALAKYGVGTQLIIAMEEMGELIQAISKNMRGVSNLYNVAEEIADVGVMLDQLMIVFKNEDIVRMNRKEKIEKLDEEMKKDEMINCD